MATLVLQFAGAALGGALGGPIGAIAGRALGGVLGATIDSALINGGGRSVEGPRLTEMAGLGSTEGAAIPRVYGRARIGGELIWATRFEEVVDIRRQGGKGSLLGGGPTATNYSYFGNFAVGLCEGPIAFVRRVWADGRELDLTRIAMRVYRGDEMQTPDPLISAKEGAENAPAYRGLSYVVFERLALADFGNRIPQLSFEVVRPVGQLRKQVHGVNLIPGAGEFAYETAPIFRDIGNGVTRPENVNQLTHATDIAASLDQLQSLCPNLESVTLIVTWFGDDLRVGACKVKPKVENQGKATTPKQWRVAGLAREDADVMSQVDGRPAYGGAPSDDSVRAAIIELRARGLKVNLHPFIMMDIAAGNALPNPWTGAAPQPNYPWRGDVTVDLAPGRAGTVDESSAAAAQIASFVGSATPSDFSIDETGVVYSGPDEWTLRRMVLHYATLAANAGGVDGFILSSELRGLTRVRGAGGAFPMTEALVSLAADARAILGSSPIITYGADWTEYGGQVPAPGELTFPLDALWASPDIDVVGVDWYAPLSDWRDGAAHADAEIANDPSNADYLQSRVASGEGFDWYYAGETDRVAQNRLPIADGAYGKPWVYRVKDLVNWWSNAHVARTGNIEIGATAWTPKSKPIWLTELGCPAVDIGSNSPNLFPDPKSSASALPPFSHGARDDLIAARAVAATLRHFDPASLQAAIANPVSPLYGDRMMNSARTHLWAWDARPFPAFPALRQVWGDAANFETGHWLNGRLEGAPLDELARAIAADFDIDNVECEGLDAFVDGYVIDRPMSLRAALEPLAGLYGFGLRSGRLGLVGGRRGAVAALSNDDLVADRDGRTIEARRAQETDLPAEATIGFSDDDNDYRRATASSRRLAGSSRRQSQFDSALVGRRAAMQAIADARLQDAWTGRETVKFATPPSRFDLETGDRVVLSDEAADRLYEIRRVSHGASRVIEARAVDDRMRGAAAQRAETPPPSPPVIIGAPRIVTLDPPIARGAPTALQYIAAFADPWPGAMLVWRKTGAMDFAPERIISTRAMMGALIDPLSAGQGDRWDDGASFRVALEGGTVSSIDDEQALAGGNAFAVQKPGGAWEILIAAQAVLVAVKTWRLSRLLRALGGSEDAARIVAPAGSTILRFDGAVSPLVDSLERLGRESTYRIGPAQFDHADPRVVELTAHATSLALKPFAPVHVRARRVAEGVSLSWVRRARLDGDAWDVVDIPLAEDFERYELDILGVGGVVKRTLTSDAASVLYASSDEIADFGAPQVNLSVALAQMSAVVGRGFERRVNLPIA